MTARAAWGRLAAATGIAGALAVSLAPPSPPPRSGLAASALLGALAGLVLFAAVTGGSLRLRRPSAGAVRLAARQCILGLCAANEEVVWRRVVLGELLPGGAVAALAASSVAFGLAHRRARSLHVVTGAAFGGLYLVTGALAASVAAHWAYNALVASHAVRRPP